MFIKWKWWCYLCIFYNSKIELEIEKCTFNSCSSGKLGGSIYFHNQNPHSESSIEECRFENSIAVEGAGAVYFAPCANSEMKKNLFINNLCVNNNAHGSSLLALIEKENNLKLKLKDEEEEIEPVVIENNKFRSKPVSNSQQLYIDLKKQGELVFDSNSFSFDKTSNDKIPSNSKYITLVKEETAILHLNGEICLDNSIALIDGLDSNAKIATDCHKADAENDNDFDDTKNKSVGGKKKVGLIVGVAVAAVVVVVIVVIVVVIFVVRKKSMGRNIDDIRTDDIADNSTVEGVTSSEYINQDNAL